MGETGRLTSISYTNLIGSDHMDILIDITLNPCGHSSVPPVMSMVFFLPVGILDTACEALVLALVL